jgi:hypothetical protein
MPFSVWPDFFGQEGEIHQDASAFHGIMQAYLPKQGSTHRIPDLLLAGFCLLPVQPDPIPDHTVPYRDFFPGSDSCAFRYTVQD